MSSQTVWELEEEGEQNPRSDQLHTKKKKKFRVRYCLLSFMFDELNRNFSYNQALGDYARDDKLQSVSCMFLFLTLSWICWIAAQDSLNAWRHSTSRNICLICLISPLRIDRSPISATDPHVQRVRVAAGLAGGRISDSMQHEKAWRDRRSFGARSPCAITMTWRRDMHRFGRTDRQLLKRGLSCIATTIAQGLMMKTIARRRLAADGALSTCLGFEIRVVDPMDVCSFLQIPFQTSRAAPSLVMIGNRF